MSSRLDVGKRRSMIDHFSGWIEKKRKRRPSVVPRAV
jgi:hypothetical protein